MRTTIFKWWRLEIESGKFPEKLLRKRDLKLRRLVRYGIWLERVSFKVEDFEKGKRKLRKKISNEVREKKN